jgi:uncharacterized protein
LCEKHNVNLIAIGNGTASRETDKLAGDLIKQLARLRDGVEIQKVVVSEAGASVYSASEFASQEMPDVDVSLRGAASIARRLQDPLSELVKIDPKAIGVGQYQHDVNQSELAKTLDAVVEDCVNSVGVDLNTASVPLLTRVSGLSGSVAKAVVRWRDANGVFKTRQDLLKVTGLGAKTFEQSAGFLRIRGGDNPLDMTGVHPETYPVVEQIIVKTAKPIQEIMGRSDVLKTLRPELFANDKFGAITIKDILGELEKPERGHDLGGHREQRGPVWSVHRLGRAPRRPGPCEPAGQQVRDRRPRGGQDRRHRQSESARSRCGPQAHQPDHEAGRCTCKTRARRKGPPRQQV